MVPLSDDIAPGTYTFICLLHAPLMAGTMTIVDEESEVADPAEVSEQGLTELDDVVAKIQVVIEAAEGNPDDQPFAGVFVEDVMNGFGISAPACGPDASARAYDIVALAVDITLDRYLDHDPDGLEGNARVVVEAGTDCTDTASLGLDTNPGFETKATYLAYRIGLVGLEPYPRSDVQEPEPYRAILVVDTTALTPEASTSPSATPSAAHRPSPGLPPSARRAPSRWRRRDSNPLTISASGP